MHGRDLTFALCGVALLALAAGCGDGPSRPAEVADPPEPPAGERFDPAAAATLSGRVTWEGDPPQVPPLVVWGEASPAGLQGPRGTRLNPNAPMVNPDGRGVANAVVFLRGLDPACARPWDLPPVCVEQRGHRLHVLQGDADARVGFVRQGAAVELVSREPVFHALRGGGAAFFTLAFPDPDQPLRRRFDQPGVVELSSAAGYFWMRAYLFVGDHPYFARTDADGRFTLPQVPPGRCEVICWMPDWHEARHDRDLETALVSRLAFRPPVERAQTVTLAPRESRAVAFAFSAEAFGR